MPPVSDNDNHDVISHDVRYAAFLKDLAKRELVKAETVSIDKPWFQNKRPRLASHEPSKSTPGERAAGRARYESLHGEKGSETKAIAKLKRQIAKRQGIGEDYTPVRGGDEIPILSVLRKDSNLDLVQVVKKYRKLVALCNADPMRGSDYEAHGLFKVRRSNLNGYNKKTGLHDDIEAASESEWKTPVNGGEITYREIKQSTRGTINLPSKRVKLADTSGDEGQSSRFTESTAVKFSTNLLHAMIDAKVILSRLRSVLGCYVGPVEDAILDAATMTHIGKQEGFEVKPEIAGKALVMRGLVALRHAWHDMKVEQQLSDELADQRTGTNCSGNTEGRVIFLKAANDNHNKKQEVA
ncbi:hypothetical protein [Phyllobacterium meliloti]|uniref:hypothetical protein n=1 Tax=Phyllobacterium meliloti TaxID=555317 RepID=UPI001D15B077|nr:hypothetical protein [Phyllobacterium sp. T1293]UGX87108.1 hypothetical protein LLE53_004475 [Phyllobacterium sp. T1293]